MRKLIYAFNLTLDGCSEHVKQFVDTEMLEDYTQMLETADTFVYGRKTYQIMVPYWPDVLTEPSASKADADFARAFVSRKKVVFSRTLEKIDHPNTRLVRGDLREEVCKMKQEPGKDIIVGGVEVPSELLKLGLIDEFRFLFGPVLVGQGRRLFENVRLPEKQRLKLRETKVLNSGCIVVRYSRE